MRNLFSTVVLAGLLGVSGCASDSTLSNGNGQAATPEWQYRTFAITASSDMELHSKIIALNQQGWSFVSVSNTSRGAVGAVVMVLMRRQTR